VITGSAHSVDGSGRYRTELAIIPASFPERPRRAVSGGHPARMVVNHALHGLLARQDGLVTVEQAARRGVPASTLRRRVHGDGWARVAPRVLLAAGHPWTARARVRAASLWAGDRAAVSGPAAAWWHGMLADAPATVEVTVPRGSGLRERPGVRIRRRDLAAADQVGVAGVWLTGKPLTTLETAVAVPDGSVFLDRALQRHVGFAAVYRSYCRNLGARGGAGIAALLTAAADRADSAAERLMISILRGAALPGWVHGLPFDRWTIDFAFPSARLAIEVDGWAWHMDVQRFRADRHKGNALVRAGWDLLRFTWHDLNNQPATVLAEIQAALRTPARQPWSSIRCEKWPGPAVIAPNR
jgi:very-short-patch-repair endonuclease